MLRTTSLVLLSTLMGCELVAGLSGERARVQHASGGAAGLEVQGGADAGCPPCVAGASAAGAAGQEEEAGASGMEGGAAGENSGAGGVGDAGAPVSDDSVPLDSQSCAGHVATCEGVDPCLTIPVPGGTFSMGRSKDGMHADAFDTGAEQELPEHVVSLSAYRLDKYEVTVGRFRRFVEAYDGTPPASNAGAHPKIANSGWESQWDSLLPKSADELRSRLFAGDPSDNTSFVTWTETPGTGECRPMNAVDWYVAFAFCIWDGGRLPSEAEWEFAAAGGEQERLFPWGKAAPQPRAVFACSFFGSASCTSGDIPHVGSTPAGVGRFGHADLAGSLAEPVRDDFESGFYSRLSASGLDVMNLGSFVSALISPIRGGKYFSSGDTLRSAARVEWRRSSPDSGVGLRCARNP